MKHRAFLNEQSTKILNNFIIEAHPDNYMTNGCQRCFQDVPGIKLLCDHEMCKRCCVAVNNYNGQCPFCRITLAFSDEVSECSQNLIER